MAQDGWRRAASDAELVEGAPRVVDLDGEKILLARVRGAVYAVGHTCPHYDEKLEKGVLFGSELVCKSHFARFDVTTGRLLSAPALGGLPTYPVEVRADEIWIGRAVVPSFPKPSTPPGTDPRLFLIVGAGAAGSSAAEWLRREGFSGRICVVTEETEPPYDRPSLSKGFLSGRSGEDALPLHSRDFYSDNGIELRTGTRATAVDPAGHAVTFADGTILRWDRLLVATGGAPRRLAVPGADEPGTFLLRTAAHARCLRETAARSRSVVIIGAGFIGLELATSLGDRGLAVTVVAPDAVPLAGVLGDRVGAALLRMHAARGVVFRLGQRPVRIDGTPGAKLVTLDDGSVVAGDIVVTGLGIDPDVGFVAGTPLVVDGAVPVDATMRTSLPDIFAAGDVAAVARPDGRRRLEHWVVAQRQGRRAALGMLDRDPGPQEVDVFWSKQAGVSLKYAARGGSWDRVVYRGTVEDARFIAGYYAGRTLQAAATIGMAQDLLAIERFLRLGGTVDAAELADPAWDIISAARAL